MPQDVHFEHAAAMFGLKYHRPGTGMSWKALALQLGDAD
jgi:2-succinyl-5-enolpyruvyl-6-hydroxy-3-cyclohexene-1-carboxylate synthase